MKAFNGTPPPTVSKMNVSKQSNPGHRALGRKGLPALLATIALFQNQKAMAGSPPSPENLLSVPSITTMLNLTAAAFPDCTLTNCNATVEVTDPRQGGVFVLTPTVIGTNTGTRLASVGLPGWSWRREYVGAININWFGAQGAPADDSVPIANAIAAAEANGPGGIVSIPSGVYRAQGLHVHRSTLAGAGATMGAWAPNSMLELVPNATDNLLYLDEAVATDNQAGSGVRDMTLSGHRSANIVNPVPIVGSTDRFNFFVDPTTLPNLVDDGTYLHYGFVFFYTAANRYAGYGWIQSVNPVTGQVTLRSDYDRYATTNSTDSLYPGWNACFTPYVSENQPARLGGGYAQSFNDPCAAGRIGVVIRSAAVTIENVTVLGFHCGIAGYTAQNVYFVNVWAQNNSFAGIANADRWSADSKFDRIFAQGFYYDAPGDAPENPPLANYTWRHMAYGIYSFWNESIYDDISVDSCVVDVADLGSHGTSIKYLLADVPIKSGFSALGSFSASDPLAIEYMEARAWGSIGSGNPLRNLPSNQGIYAGWDGAVPPRYYSIGQLLVDTYANSASNSFSAAFNYNIYGQTNSPIEIAELAQFTGATNWFIGSGPPPLVDKVSPAAAAGFSSNPDGWVQTASGAVFSFNGNSLLGLNANGTVTASNLNVANLTSPMAAFGNLEATTFTSPNGNINSLTSANMTSGVATISDLVATTIYVTSLNVVGETAATITSGAANITNLNASVLNAKTLTAGSMSSTLGWIASLGAGGVAATTGSFNVLSSLNLSANSGNVAGLVVGTGTMTNLAVNSLNAGAESVASLAAGFANVTNLYTISLNAGSVGASNVNVGQGLFNSLGTGSLKASSATINGLTTLSFSANSGAFMGLSAKTAFVTNLNTANLNAAGETVGSLAGGYGNFTNLNATTLTAGTIQASSVSSPQGWFPTLGGSVLSATSGSINTLTTLNLSGNIGSFAGFTTKTATITNLTVASVIANAESVGSISVGSASITNLNAGAMIGGSVVVSNVSSQQGWFNSLNGGSANFTTAAVGSLNGSSIVANSGNLAGLVSKTAVITNLTTANLSLKSANGGQTALFPLANGGFASRDVVAGQNFFSVYTDNLSYSTISLGVPTAAPRNLLVVGDVATGADIPGADLVMRGIPGTGTNVSGGNIRLYTMDLATNDTASQPLRERFTVLRSGAVQFHPPSTAPVAAAGEVYSDGLNLYFADSGNAWLPLQRSRPVVTAVSLAFGVIDAASQGIATVSAPGASAADVVAASPQATLPNGIVFSGARVRSGGILEVTLQNVVGTPVNAGTISFNVRLLK